MLLATACAAPPATETSTVPPSSGPLEVCINEFMPANDGSLFIDEQTPDWVELHNPSDTPVALAGWTLDDGSDEASLDGLTLGAGEYLVLLANEQPGPMNLPFRLDADGGEIRLRGPGGQSRVSYGDTALDIAWSRSPDCCTEADCWIEAAFGTPGESNPEPEPDPEPEEEG